MAQLSQEPGLVPELPGLDQLVSLTELPGLDQLVSVEDDSGVLDSERSELEVPALPGTGTLPTQAALVLPSVPVVYNH